MVFNVNQIVALLSRGHTLKKGDIVLTGTPPGIGWFRKPRLALQHGNRVKVAIEGLSTLINVVEYA
jgi:2-keto-4-pentenoate hydratase/2-oxohepta-3-ene-1,7-dioic acid hydratase in catechol pathway